MILFYSSYSAECIVVVAVIIVIIVIILGNAGWRKAAAQVAARGRLPGRVC